jgi:hypothetical protein
MRGSLTASLSAFGTKCKLCRHVVEVQSYVIDANPRYEPE